MQLIIIFMIIYIKCSTIFFNFGNSELEDVADNKFASSRLLSTTTTTIQDNYLGIVLRKPRSTLGVKVEKAPPNVGHVFRPILQGMYPEYYYGRMAGFSLHLKNNYSIVHKDTLVELQDSNNGKTPYFNGHIMIPAPPTIHNNYQGDSIISIKEYEIIQKGLGGSNFHLVKFYFNEPGQQGLRISTKNFAKLEKNRQEFGNNCSILSYSYYAMTNNPAKERKFPDAILPDLYLKRPEIYGQVVELAKIYLYEPDAKRCMMNGSCYLRVDYEKSSVATICNHELELGAPIFCGQDKRITYLAEPLIEKIIGCQANSFSVFHVPNLIDDIEKHIKIE